MDLLEVIVVAILSIFTGLILWYLTTYLKARRFKSQFQMDFSDLSGHWQGVHISKDDSRGGLFLSRHSYDLHVTSDGRIRGTCDELDSSYRFDMQGNVTPEGIFLLGKARVTQESTFTWFFNLIKMLQDTIPGFYITSDFDGSPSVSLIVLSREKIEEKKYFDILKNYQEMFYIHTISKTKQDISPSSSNKSV